ncbi:hypothetical protein GOP47_0021318 [Adiantum capillus-veneris]|uniref:C3H1-type domain-containing protein n=1 Tax=Adiantum capillus-veneris TaxID=13818 RepID=A0A9D4UAV6_ADICA|nr:hypothetical protein GOP47_0021318 [Adiantum capillus-veneris]
MPGVLVESSASSAHPFFPFESSTFSNGCFDSNGGFDVSSPHADLAPLSPHSPLSVSHYPHLDALGSSPPSPSYRARELAQRFLPKSNLGLALNGNMSETSPEFASELTGMPIPSPRKSLYTNGSADCMVGSPLFSDGNGVGSPIFSDAFSAFHKFLPSNTNDDESWPADAFPAMDAYSCDDFRMYEFKVRRCMRGRSHDWTECPFAHPGEKARRRDPRRIHYSGTACPDFRKGSCKRGDSCEYAHGVFECWLHPARYRTQPCKDGRACRRRVCFFAHTVEQLRVLPSASSAVSTTTNSGAGSPRKAASSYDSSSFRQALAGSLYIDNASDSMTPKEDRGLFAPRILQKAMESKGFGGGGYSVSSPTSTVPSYHSGSPPPLSPPLSPSSSPPMSPDLCWPRNLTSPQTHVQSPLSNVSTIPGHRRHLNRLQTMPTISIPSDASDFAVDAAKFDDMSFSLPASAHMQSPHGTGVSELLHSLQTLQLCTRIAELQKSASTPSSPQSLKYSLVQQSPLRQCLYRSIPGTPSDSMWDLSLDNLVELEPPLRVESGRDLRAKIYGKIGKENGVECGEDPDLGWVNELVM